MMLTCHDNDGGDYGDRDDYYDDYDDDGDRRGDDDNDDSDDDDADDGGVDDSGEAWVPRSLCVWYAHANAPLEHTDENIYANNKSRTKGSTNMKYFLDMLREHFSIGIALVYWRTLKQFCLSVREIEVVPLKNEWLFSAAVHDDDRQGGACRSAQPRN